MDTDSTGSRHRFRVGEVVSPLNGAWTGVVVSVVTWRDCVLTMNDVEATLFTDHIRSRCGDAGVQTYQRVGIDVSSGLIWEENFNLVAVDEQRKVGSVEGESGGKSG
jgi:hypothetical protein